MGASDYIELRDMAFFAHHGVHEEELRMGQRFFVTIRVALDLRRPGDDDSLRETVNYADLHAIALAMQGQPGARPKAGETTEVLLSDGRRVDVPLGPFRLLEALAHHLALEILRHFELAAAVRIDIRKPSVPIAGILEYAAIGVERNRADLAAEPPRPAKPKKAKPASRPPQPTGGRPRRAAPRGAAKRRGG